MKNFQCLAQGVDTGPLLHALQLQPGLWNEHRLRTAHPGSAHREADDVWVRFNAPDQAPAALVDDLECRWYPAARLLPVRPFLFDLMRRVEGERLGRVVITRLAPGAVIYPHTDDGESAAYYERYHLILQAFPGVRFRAGEETISPRTGELWWFDNRQEHEILNYSSQERLHLIADVRVAR